jgi:hypothetical protein
VGEAENRVDDDKDDDGLSDDVAEDDEEEEALARVEDVEDVEAGGTKSGAVDVDEATDAELNTDVPVVSCRFPLLYTPRSAIASAMTCSPHSTASSAIFTPWPASSLSLEDLCRPFPFMTFTLRHQSLGPGIGRPSSSCSAYG